jgi:hypothetical protein
MALFHADTTVGGDGSDYTDDDDITTGLFNGGHIIRLVPMFQQITSIALWVKNKALDVFANTELAENWATLTTGLVSAIDYSAKAWAIGGSGINDNYGSAKDWATKTLTVGNTGLKSAKSYAQDAEQSVSEINTIGAATGLQTTSYPVVVSASLPPSIGQTLVATSPTSAEWLTNNETCLLKEISFKSCYNLPITPDASLSKITYVDENRILLSLIASNISGIYAVVFDVAANTFGTPILVRTNVNTSAFDTIKIAEDLILIVSCNTTTGLEATTLTISGNSITVNAGTKSTVTLASNVTEFKGDILKVGSSYIVSYFRSGATGIRAITISGTSPTIGAEVIPTTFQAAFSLLYTGSGNVFSVVAATSATVIACIPFAVSGATLSQGTLASVTVTFYQPTQTKSTLLSNGDILLFYVNATPFAAIFKLTATTQAVSFVSLNMTGLDGANYLAAHDIGGGKVVVCYSYQNTSGCDVFILQDTNGAITKGSSLNIKANTQIPLFLSINGNTASFLLKGSSSRAVIKIDASTMTPALLSYLDIATFSGADIYSDFNYSNTISGQSDNLVFKNANGDLVNYATTAYVAYYQSNSDRITRMTNSPALFGTSFNAAGDNEKIILSALNFSLTVRIVELL